MPEGFHIASAWVDVDADTDPANRKIDALIAKLESAFGKTYKAKVGVDGADQATADAGKVGAAVDAVGRRRGRGKVGVDGADAAVSSIEEVIAKMDEAGLTVRSARLRVKEEGLAGLHQAISELDQFGIKKVTANANVNIGGALVSLSALKAAQDAASASAGRLSDTSKYLKDTFGIFSTATKAQTFTSKQAADMNKRLADSFGLIRSQATAAALSTKQLAAANDGLEQRFTAVKFVTDQAAAGMQRYMAALRGADEITAEAASADALLRQGRVASIDATLALANSQKILAQSTDEAIAAVVEDKVAAAADKTAAATARAAAGQRTWTQRMLAGVPVLGAMARTQIPLFDGALRAIPFLGAVGGIHLLIDGIAEVAAVVIPATIAFAAFGAAAVPTVQDIVTQMKNLQTVTQATGQSLYPLTGGLQKVAAAVQPQVYQIFGDALTVMNKKTGEFTTLAKGAGGVLDQLAARLTIALTRGNGFGQFLKNAVPDLQQLGTVVANIGGILGNFLKSMPGYAQVLLTSLTGVTHVLETVTGSGAAQWFMRFGLAAHGALLYTGLLATSAVKMLTGFGKFPGVLSLASDWLGKGAAAAAKFGGSGNLAERALGGLSSKLSMAQELRWGWISLGAAAVGVLAYKFITAKDAADNFIASFNQGLASAPLNKVSTTISSGIAAMNDKLGAAKIRMDQLPGSILPVNRALAPIAPGLQNVTNALDKIGKIAPGALDLLTLGASTIGKALLDSAAPAATAVHDYQAYRAEISKLNQQSVAFHDNLGRLAVQFGGTGAAMGILNAAGITAKQMMDDSIAGWVQIQVQVQGTINAYQAMGQRAGMLGADMNALTIAGSDQVTAMSKLNSAWDTTIGIVSGGQGAFIAFQQSVLSTGMALHQTGGHGRVVTDTFKAAAAAAKAAGASMNGLNAPSLQLRATWQSAYANGAKLIDALRMMSAASPGGFPSLSRAAKDVIAQMAPLGSLSAATRAELVSMAQEMKPGIKNWQDLTTWLGNTKNAGQDLNNVLAKGGINLQNLAADAAKMSNVLQNAVVDKFAKSRLAANHVGQAIDALNQAIAAHTAKSPLAAAAAVVLAKKLEKSGYSAKAAATLIAALTGIILKVPTGHHTKFTVDNSQALAAIALAYDRMQALKDKTVHINVVTHNFGGHTGPALGGIVTPAGVLTPGGLVTPGSHGLVVPGYAPGQDTAGPYMLSPGEGVLVPEAVRGIGGPAAVYGLNRRYAGARIARGNKTGTFAAGGITTSASAAYGFPAADIYLSVNITNPGPPGYAASGTVQGIIDGLLHPPHRTRAQRQLSAAEQRVRAFEQAGLTPALEFAHGMTDITKIQDATRTAIDAIRKYYTGATMHRLISVIGAQSKDLQTLARRNDAVVAEMKAMKQYAANVSGNLASSYSDLSNIQGPVDAQGNPLPVTGQFVKSQLAARLARLRRFLGDIRALAKDKLGKTLIGQVIALGPDQGVDYAEAILRGGPGLASELRQIENEITSVETTIGQKAAEIQYGQSVSKGFLSGLKAEHSHLVAEMRKLGDEIAKELAHDFGDKALYQRLTGKGGGTPAPPGPGQFVEGHPPRHHHLQPGGGQVAGNKHHHVQVINFNGVRFPSPEQVQSVKMALATAVSNA